MTDDRVAASQGGNQRERGSLRNCTPENASVIGSPVQTDERGKEGALMGRSAGVVSVSRREKGPIWDKDRGKEGASIAGGPLDNNVAACLPLFFWGVGGTYISTGVTSA